MESPLLDSVFDVNADLYPDFEVRSDLVKVPRRGLPKDWRVQFANTPMTDGQGCPLCGHQS